MKNFAKLFTQKALNEMNGIGGLNTTEMNKKKRSLIDTHHRLQELHKEKIALSALSSAWFLRTPTEFLGTTHTNRGTARTILYYMNKDEVSYSNEYPFEKYQRNPLHLLGAIRDDELPLYINLPQYQDNKAQELLQGRLKGEYKEIPYHQGLVDERDKLDHKFKRIWTVIRAYERIIEEYVYENKRPKHYNNTQLIIYTIEGHEYYFKTHGERTLISPENIERIT